MANPRSVTGVTAGVTASVTASAPAPSAPAYLGEQTITGQGVSLPASLPPGARSAIVTAEGGPLYLSLNGPASPASGLYIPADTSRTIGPYTNLASLAVFAAPATRAHLLFEG